MQMFPWFGMLSQESEANQIGIGALPAFLSAKHLFYQSKNQLVYFGELDRTPNRRCENLAIFAYGEWL